MPFKMKYEIKKDYIPVRSGNVGRRSGAKMQKVGFGVLHDTGNSGSTAQNNVDYFKSTPQHSSGASAHTFIDDKNIIECIPLTTGTPEKAHHVLYNVTTDNVLYGDDANDIGAGVELCFGGSINFEEAYKRYIWYCAYVSYKFGFDSWIGHEKLDPARKTDPSNALKRYGKTYEQLLKDIQAEYNDCTAEPIIIKEVEPVKDGVYFNNVKLRKGQVGILEILKDINMYKPDRSFHEVLKAGRVVSVYSVLDKNNYKYNVGAGYSVSNIDGYVKYTEVPQNVIEANKEYYGG